VLYGTDTPWGEVLSCEEVGFPRGNLEIIIVVRIYNYVTGVTQKIYLGVVGNLLVS